MRGGTTTNDDVAERPGGVTRSLRWPAPKIRPRPAGCQRRFGSARSGRPAATPRQPYGKIRFETAAAPLQHFAHSKKQCQIYNVK
jgi:hypothetical protein